MIHIKKKYMCLSNAKKIELENDLTVYKVVRIYDGNEDDIYPLVGHGHYRFNVIESSDCQSAGGELFGTKMLYSIMNDEYRIYDGMFHSFSELYDCDKYVESIYNDVPNLKIVECVIPKESLVFEGDFCYYDVLRWKVKSYASNKIIYKRIIK